MIDSLQRTTILQRNYCGSQYYFNFLTKRQRPQMKCYFGCTCSHINNGATAYLLDFKFTLQMISTELIWHPFDLSMTTTDLIIHHITDMLWHFYDLCPLKQFCALECTCSTEYHISTVTITQGRKFSRYLNASVSLDWPPGMDCDDIVE